MPLFTNDIIIFYIKKSVTDKKNSEYKINIQN